VDAVGESLDNVILKVLETKQPKNVKELVQFVQDQVSASLDDITKEVKNLQQKGLIVLEEPTVLKNRFSDSLSSRKDIWFWVTISLTLLAFISIVFFPESGTPLSYLRYGFGFILAAFLPGYCLTETLFPRKSAMDEIERFTFSIGLSFAVTALVGLFLSFTPFGLTLTTALITLGFVVIVLALAAFKRKRKIDE
jgi:uncharacterized membrane protein